MESKTSNLFDFIKSYPSPTETDSTTLDPITAIMSSKNNSIIATSAAIDESLLSYQNFNLFTDLATVLTALFYGSAFILGTIGNGLIIYIVAHYPRMRTLSNVFLASLAIADLLLVCVCIPIKFVQLITYTWTFGVIMCKAIHYVQSLSTYCSVLTLTIISVERYYAIIHPVQCRATFSMRHIRKMICLTWVLSAILASPTMGVYMLERIGHEFESDHFWCVKKDSDWATGPDLRQRWYKTRVIYELYQILTILILPTLVMIFTYSRICTHLWTVFHHRTAMRFGHACHFLNNNNCSNTNTSSGVFTASMSSSSTSTTNTTTTINNNNNRNSLLLLDPESANPIVPPTPTSLASSIQSNVCSLSSRRQSRQSCCQQCYHHLKTSDEDNQTVKQVIKMLVAVVVLFVLCWAPTLVIGLLRAFNLIAETNEGILKEIITVTFLLSYLNSVINPIIYGFMSKNFCLYFRLIFIQFWSLLTTGRFVDHRHHHHHHHRGQSQQKFYRNCVPIGSVNQQMEIQMDPQGHQQPVTDMQRKHQSWKFSPNNYHHHNQKQKPIKNLNSKSVVVRQQSSLKPNMIGLTNNKISLQQLARDHTSVSEN